MRSDLYAMVQQIANGQLDTTERLGHVMRELAEQGTQLRHLRAEVAELKAGVPEMRRKLESLPGDFEDAAEVTARHQIDKLKAEIESRRADSQSAQLRRLDDRRWQVILAVLTASIAFGAGWLAHWLGR